MPICYNKYQAFDSLSDINLAEENHELGFELLQICFSSKHTYRNGNHWNSIDASFIILTVSFIDISAGHDGIERSACSDGDDIDSTPHSN